MEKSPNTNIDWDIRFFRRYPKRTECSLGIKEKIFPATAVDYSLIGVGLIMDDVEAPVVQGDVVSITINELGLHERGKIAWVRKTPSVMRVGILRPKPLKGSFRLYPLSDILIGLQRTLRTGILDVRQGAVNKKIYIKSGNVISAASNYNKDRLGDVLLKSRRINRRQYDKAAEIKMATGGRYPAILVQMGCLRPRDVIGAAELQTRRIIATLFAMKEAEFAFIEGPLPSRDAVTLNLSVADLIYRVLKKNADVDLVENFLLDSVVDFSSNPLNLFQNIHFTPADRTLISFIDGKTTIRDIILLSPRSRINPLKIIYALLEARFLKIKGRHESPSGVQAAEILGAGGKPGGLTCAEIDRQYQQYKELDYYHILDVGRSSSIEEIKKAYYRAARKYHPDMNLHLPEDVKKKLIEIFASITTACLTLTDSEKRRKYDRLVTTAAAGNKPPQMRAPESALREEAEERVDVGKPFSGKTGVNADMARLRLRDGKVAFWDKNYNKAARLFATAISLDKSVPEYHYYYGVTLEMLGKLREAVQTLNKANELKPMDADILAELGHVFLKLGFPIRAKGYFTRAVNLAPSNGRAMEGLALMKGKKLH